MTSGIASPIRTAATTMARLTLPSTRPANTAAAAAPSLSRTRSHAGTSAAFNEPSVSARRITLIPWNATRNASATGPAPSSAATMASRANPKSREASVPVETVRTGRIMVQLSWPAACWRREERDRSRHLHRGRLVRRIGADSPYRRNCHNRNRLMAETKYDVLGIGNAIFDVLVKTDEAFLTRHGMTKGGMALIDEARAAAIY